MFLLHVSKTYFIDYHHKDILQLCFWIPFFLLSVYFFILLECILIKLCWEIKVMQGRYTFANLKMHLLYPYIWITVWLSIDSVVASHFFTNLWRPYQCYIPSTSENNSWHILDTQEIFVECTDEWMQYFFSKFFWVLFCFLSYVCPFLPFIAEDPPSPRNIYWSSFAYWYWRKRLQKADLRVLSTRVLLKLWFSAWSGNLLKRQILWLYPTPSETETLKMGPRHLCCYKPSRWS